MQIGSSLPPFTPAPSASAARPLSSDVSLILPVPTRRLSPRHRSNRPTPLLPAERRRIAIPTHRHLQARPSQAPRSSASSSWKSPISCNVTARCAPTSRRTRPLVGNTPVRPPTVSSAVLMGSVTPFPAKSASIPLPSPMIPKRRCARWKSSCAQHSHPSNLPAGPACSCSGSGAGGAGAR